MFVRWKEGFRNQGEKKTEKARLLRRKMTDAERKLWRLLRDRRMMELKFRRQVPFGPFYLDFYCVEKNLVIELDGGQHFESEGMEKDRKRDGYLESKGLKILRYSDRDVLTYPEGILEDIFEKIVKTNPHPNPLLFKERERQSFAFSRQSSVKSDDESLQKRIPR